MKTPLSERLVHVEEYDEFIHKRSLVERWIINEVKELEKQNGMMLEALEKFTKIEYAMSKDLTIYGNTYVPEEWLQFLTIARDIIANVKGENQ